MQSIIACLSHLEHLSSLRSAKSLYAQAPVKHKVAGLKHIQCTKFVKSILFFQRNRKKTDGHLMLHKSYSRPGYVSHCYTACLLSSQYWPRDAATICFTKAVILWVKSHMHGYTSLEHGYVTALLTCLIVPGGVCGGRLSPMLNRRSY